jgi:hypothetical protein
MPKGKKAKKDEFTEPDHDKLWERVCHWFGRAMQMQKNAVSMVTAVLDYALSSGCA